MGTRIHKQNLKRVWRVRARVRQAVRLRLNDPEWCRRAEAWLERELKD
jgi:hypothetical protein